MHKRRYDIFIRTLIFIFILLISSIQAVELEKVSRIQPAGLLILRASLAGSNSAVKWEISAYTLDENTGARADQGVISLAYRDSVRILLVKTANKYTFYKVIVTEDNNKDSVEFQVFNKGAAEKYLFQNPIIQSKPIPVYIILPSKYSSESKFLMSMHGTNRNADDYANIWKSFGSANNYIITAPEFSSSLWSSSSYILGNMFTGSNGAGSLNPKEYWTFYLVQLIHKELAEMCGLSDSTYTIWGHSAGAQFVHRMALFCPDNLISRYISANAGWYTVPDLEVIYPWGVKHALLTNITSGYLYEFTTSNLVIMRGTADTLRDSNLNTDPLSDAQGRNRFERAGYYYNKALEINPSLTWPFIDVLNVGHDDAKMALAAGEFILSSVTSVAEKGNEIIDGSGISSYPNPFNASTQIVFSVSKASHVLVAVYNAIGEKVITLTNEFMNPGKYIRSFNAGNLSSGVYFCTLTNGGTVKTAKILLLK